MKTKAALLWSGARSDLYKQVIAAFAGSQLEVRVNASHDGKIYAGELNTFANLGISCINLANTAQSGELRYGNVVLACDTVSVVLSSSVKRVKRFWESFRPQNFLLLAVIATSSVALIGCKEHKPQPTCRQTLKVVERNGQRVLESLNGIYLKEDFPVGGCVGRPYSDDHYQHHYVQSGSEQLYWFNSKLYTGKEMMAAKAAGKWPEVPSGPGQMPYAIVEIGIGFWAVDAPEPKPSPDWWYRPAMPHKLYPIDLLPNFGLEKPSPQANIDPIKDLDQVYWAIRGSKSLRTGEPYTTRCDIQPPPGNPAKDVSYQGNPAWLIQGETYTKYSIGNTCRGGVNAGNGKRLGAYVDVPGMAVKDIDKIYRAVAQHLSDLTVE